MRAKLFALIALIGIGAAGYVLLPYTPVPGYFDALVGRVTALAGFGTDSVRDRVLPELETDLSQAELSLGSPVFIRAFAREGDVEIWLRDGTRYSRFHHYTTCDADGNSTATGLIAPGVYHINADGLRPHSAEHLAALMQPLASTPAADTPDPSGTNPPSLHGDCAPVPGIALKNRDIEKIYVLIEAALRAGQSRIQVHVFDSAKTIDDATTPAIGQAGTAIDQGSVAGLHDVYVAFERDRVPPEVVKSDGRYRVATD